MKSALFKMTVEELNFSIIFLLLILERFFNPFDCENQSLIPEFLLAAMILTLSLTHMRSFTHCS